jgi:hypothetical protein
MGGETTASGPLLMFASRSRIPFCVSVLLGAGVITLCLSVLLPAPERIGKRAWEKYYTLHIQASGGAQRLILQILESRNVDSVVSRFTAQESFNTFDGFVSVPIHRLSERLDPLDPRFDSYMQRLEKLFSVDNGIRWEVAYLRSDRNLLSTYMRLRGIFRSTDLKWRLIDFDPPTAVIKLLLLILYLAVLIPRASAGSIRLALLLAGVPWLILVVISDFSVLLAFFVLMPAWANLFEHMHSLRYTHSSSGPAAAIEVLFRPAAALLIAGGLGILLNLPGPFAGVLLAMAGGAVATAFLYCFFIFQDSLQAHRPFRALPILGRLRPRRSAIAPAVTLHLLLAFIVLSSYPLLHLGAAVSGADPDTIRMRSIGYDELSWSSLHALSDYASPGGLPNLADYLTHQAYQESLIFGRPYELPDPGERIMISEYRVSPHNARIQKTYRVVKQFKESWLHATLDAAAPGSVARLLADQGFAGTLEIAPAAEPVSRYGVSVLLIILFLLQFLVPRYFNLTASVLYATRNLTLRRH